MSSGREELYSRVYLPYLYEREEIVTGITEVLMKALAFVAIIAMGYGLKRTGFFHAKDFYLLSKIVIKITLPAAIVANFSKISMESSMLILCVFGLICNGVLLIIAYCINLTKSGKQKAFDMLNMTGYNIGNFTMPFVQSFLGPVGFAATSLFDAGNSVMCTGVTFSLASTVSNGSGNGPGSFRTVLKTLVSSVPFDTYVIMTLLTVLRLKLPDVVILFAETAGGANAFLALLMIGIGFEIHMDKEKIAEILKILVIRYGTALAFSLGFFFLLPFPLEVRQALAIVVLAPVSSVSPAFTGKIGGDVELSSAINSLTIVISIVVITGALILIL